MHVEASAAAATAIEASAPAVGEVEAATVRASARKAVVVGMGHDSALAVLHGSTTSVVAKVAVVAWDVAAAGSCESTSQVWSQ